MFKKLSLLMLAVLPSQLKVFILNKMGHDIHPTCRIGLSYLDAERLVLRAGSRISSFNYIKGLKILELEEKARIGGVFNWLTASKLHASDDVNHGCIKIGEGSNITSRHFFDAQQKISIGKNTLIAGFRGSFWTHGYRRGGAKENGAIIIGDNCYVGSQCIFLPGAAIADYSFVGAGSVVSKRFNESYCLIAGNPADVQKRYASTEDFFSREHDGFLPQ